MKTNDRLLKQLLRELSRPVKFERVISGPYHRLLMEGYSANHQRRQIVAATKAELGKPIQIRHIVTGRCFYESNGFSNSGILLQIPVQEYIVYYTIRRR